MLKANFKITETGGSGVVQLQWSADGMAWQPVGAPLTLAQGILTVDDTANLVIDTAIFTPGQTYQYRLADQSGSPVSNVKVYTIPAITVVAYGTGTIGFVQTGADQYEFTIPGTPDTLSIPDDGTPVAMSYGISFWHLQQSTTVAQAAAMTPADVTIPTGGYGAGVYQCDVGYSRGADPTAPDAMGFTLSRYVKVDGTGTILADIQLNGITVSGTTGLTSTETVHIVQTGVSFPVFWMAYDGNTATPLATGTTATLTVPPGTIYIFAVVDCDATITDDVAGDIRAVYHAIRTA